MSTSHTTSVTPSATSSVSPSPLLVSGFKVCRFNEYLTRESSCVPCPEESLFVGFILPLIYLLAIALGTALCFVLISYAMANCRGSLLNGFSRGGRLVAWVFIVFQSLSSVAQKITDPPQVLSAYLIGLSSIQFTPSSAPTKCFSVSPFLNLYAQATVVLAVFCILLVGQFYMHAKVRFYRAIPKPSLNIEDAHSKNSVPSTKVVVDSLEFPIVQTGMGYLLRLLCLLYAVITNTAMGAASCFDYRIRVVEYLSMQNNLLLLKKALQGELASFSWIFPKVQDLENLKEYVQGRAELNPLFLPYTQALSGFLESQISVPISSSDNYLVCYESETHQIALGTGVALLVFFSVGFPAVSLILVYRTLISRMSNFRVVGRKKQRAWAIVQHLWLSWLRAVDRHLICLSARASDIAGSHSSSESFPRNSLDGGRGNDARGVAKTVRCSCCRRAIKALYSPPPASDPASPEGLLDSSKQATQFPATLAVWTNDEVRPSCFWFRQATQAMLFSVSISLTFGEGLQRANGGNDNNHGLWIAFVIPFLAFSLLSFAYTYFRPFPEHQLWKSWVTQAVFFISMIMCVLILVLRKEPNSVFGQFLAWIAVISVSALVLVLPYLLLMDLKHETILESREAWADWVRRNSRGKQRSTRRSQHHRPWTEPPDENAVPYIRVTPPLFFEVDQNSWKRHLGITTLQGCDSLSLPIQRYLATLLAEKDRERAHLVFDIACNLWRHSLMSKTSRGAVYLEWASVAIGSEADTEPRWEAWRKHSHTSFAQQLSASEQAHFLRMAVPCLAAALAKSGGQEGLNTCKGLLEEPSKVWGVELVVEGASDERERSNDTSVHERRLHQGILLAQQGKFVPGHSGDPLRVHFLKRQMARSKAKDEAELKK